MAKRRNIVGPEIRKIRNQKKWTQEQLSAKCGIVGLDISRGTLSQIEAQIRGVSDLEMVLLAKALRVDISLLIPRLLPQWRSADRTGRFKST